MDERTSRERTSRRDFVLVHGAWHGGWCWSRVARLLTDAGHRVFAPSLTGLADRAHLFTPRVGMASHIEDIVRLVEFEGLEDFVLVGHSYAGSLLSGVGDRLRERVSHYVYLDAVVPPDEARSWRWADVMNEQGRRERIAAIEGEGRGLMLPPPPVGIFGIRSDADRDFVASRLTPMPAATFLDPIVLRAGGTRGLRRTYVAAAAPVYQALRPVAERIRGDAGWRFEEIDAGHDMMLDAPQALCARLLAFAGEA